MRSPKRLVLYIKSILRTRDRSYHFQFHRRDVYFFFFDIFRSKFFKFEKEWTDHWTLNKIIKVDITIKMFACFVVFLLWGLDLTLYLNKYRGILLLFLNLSSTKSGRYFNKVWIYRGDFYLRIPCEIIKLLICVKLNHSS